MTKNNVLLKKLRESVFSTLPIVAIILIVNFTVKPMPGFDLCAFLVGSVFLIIGMWLYTLGVEKSLSPIGEHIGSRITTSKKLWFLLVMSFVLGFIVTIAEPDLAVLQEQVGIAALKYIIAIGVGVFMLLSVLRILFRVKLKYLLLALYAVAFVFVFVADESVVSLAFDSGGVTTGPITVPFIIALSAGISTVLGGKDGGDSEFGTIGICSLGPILAVVVLGIVMKIDPKPNEITAGFSSYGDVAMSFLRGIPVYFKEVLIALAPIFLVFILFQIFSIKMGKKPLVKILIGMAYAVIGLSFFFVGVNVGFMPTGQYIGKVLAAANKWLIVPVGMVVGLFIVFAEPAVHILARQVAKTTNNVIGQKTMLLTLAVAMAVAVGLAMLRVATGIDIRWFLAVGYGLAIVSMFFVPEIFTGIAFDSGGVASGPMTATFLLPFATGACVSVYGYAAGETFGVVSMVAMTPLIAVQAIGFIYKLKSGKAERKATRAFHELLLREGEIVELEDLYADRDRMVARKWTIEEIDEKIKALREEIARLQGDLEEKKAELGDLLKLRKETLKEGNANG